MAKFNYYLLLLTICYAVLAGCGKKGPLYIPEQRYPQQVEQPAPATPPVAQPSKESP